MPNYFTLTPKGKTKPEAFASIDKKLRKHFKQPADPENFLGGWYDTIGTCLAMGQSLEEIASKDYWSEGTRAIAEYLRDHYDTKAWYSPR